MCCENFMVLQVKITLAVNKIQGDLVMLREKEAIVTVIGVKRPFCCGTQGTEFSACFHCFFSFEKFKKIVRQQK